MGFWKIVKHSTRAVSFLSLIRIGGVLRNGDGAIPFFRFLPLPKKSRILANDISLSSSKLRTPCLPSLEQPPRYFPLTNKRSSTSDPFQHLISQARAVPTERIALDDQNGTKPERSGGTPMRMQRCTIVLQPLDTSISAGTWGKCHGIAR
ncbi:hypothetical protein Hypma_010989 [Hypsizygus marmoreus]|uniref:Uncharacterized protein n=1 Tax=Hypsizygus marmoreus TaxID=39966 RepID=A0A369JL57_HYPMA|nr:hypothetical protein Hypma_010989 [Hypsizygus marmoreus]